MHLTINVACVLHVVERHRKEKINAGINRIGNLLPCSRALKQVRDNVESLFCMISKLSDRVGVCTRQASELSCGMF